MRWIRGDISVMDIYREIVTLDEAGLLKEVTKSIDKEV